MTNHALAGCIVRAIETNRPRLVMPRLMLASLLVRALPPAAFDAVMDFFGITRSMDHFAGRGPLTVGAVCRGKPTRH